MDARGHALQILSTPNADTRFSQAYFPKAIREASGCLPHQAYEALWGLVADGLVYLDPAGQGSSTDNWQWRLSALGTRVISGGPWEPADPEGYLRRLRQDIPALDLDALAYVEEALRSFSARCYIAASVMLGVASEQVFNGLAAALVASHPATTQKLQNLIVDPRATYYARFQELRKRLEPIRDTLPAPLTDTLTLDAVADLLRVTRNNAGHPTGVSIDEDTARTHLQMAALYLRKMTALRMHLQQAAPAGP